MEINRQWIFRRRPEGMVSEQHFEYREAPVPQSDLSNGKVLVRNLYLSFDPAMRGWMDDVPSYFPPVALGEPMRGAAAARVVDSNNPDLPVGSLVQGLFGWQDYCIADPMDLSAPTLMAIDQLPKLTLPVAMNVLGGTGMTAYFGLVDVGAPKSGETVVVSAAAGATGSVVAQIARILGCRVIGIAGGTEKCRWLKEEARLDEAIDYRQENVTERLGALCPNGINIYFDNVGGALLEAALTHIAEQGRIVMCGQIASYNDATPTPGPSNLVNIIFRRCTMRGFLMTDYIDRLPEAFTKLGQWLMSGEIAHQEDIQYGFENIPATLLRVFNGQNQGKQLLCLEQPT